MVDGLTTNLLANLFSSLIKLTHKESYPDLIYKTILEKQGQSRIPRDIEAASGFITKNIYAKSYIARYILERLENFDLSEPISILGNPNITIEHIFPQNPCKQWSEDLHEIEYMSFTNKYLNTVGNLTLSGNNGELGNQCFIDNQNMNNEGKEQ